jgi:hypothetical protein
MSQHDNFAKGLWPLLLVLVTIAYKDFLHEIFYNLLFKILRVSLLQHIFYVNLFQITMIFRV